MRRNDAGFIAKVGRRAELASLADTAGNVAQQSECRIQPFGRLPWHTHKSLFVDQEHAL
jgi:hypothetical protein